MATYEDKWFEIRYADGVDVVPSHLLIATSNPEDRSRVLVIDPDLEAVRQKYPAHFR